MDTEKDSAWKEVKGMVKGRRMMMKAVQRDAYCVNFHVGEFCSPSTIFGPKARLFHVSAPVQRRSSAALM